MSMAVVVFQRYRSRSRSNTPPHWKQEQSRLKPLAQVVEEEAERRWAKGDMLDQEEEAQETPRPPLQSRFQLEHGGEGSEPEDR